MIRSFAIVVAVAAVAAHATDAAACGCFAQPNVATPVVQAGERILFAHEGDQVIAYIQIKYQGAAADFGWIVPLPSVPTLEVGTDELFTMLDSATLPQYQLTYNRQFCGGGGVSTTTSEGGCGFFGDSSVEHGAGGAGSDMGIAAAYDMGAANIVVEQASIGPYDYAVLKADDESAMLQWLNDNHYFVPANTDAAVMPYIHPGAYFLALKLHGGETAGDIAPIVLRYTSDLPMIPITLTQVGAVDNMGILVWVAGEARAIPHNYYHVVLDDLPVWFDNFSTYNQALIDAVHEAPSKHGFITQYAGSSAIVQGRLDYPGRFGDPTILRQETTPSDYLHYLRDNGYPFDGVMLSILEKYLPEPQALVDAGVPPLLYYTQYDNYAQYGSGPDADGGAAMPFDPGPITDEIVARVVTPMQEVDALLGRHPYLTRLYTALSPKDMTLDPVFSSNADLPEVPLLHTATLTTPCSGQPWLATDAGFEVQYLNGIAPNLNLPYALRVELLRDAGQPETVQDNTATIPAALGPVDRGSSNGASSSSGGDTSSSSSGCGCSIGKRRVHADVAMLFILCGAALGVRSLRRRRS